MGKRRHHYIANFASPQEEAAVHALSAMHPEWNDEECDTYDEHEPFTLQEAAAMWKATGRDSNFMFGFTEDELENA